jgi:protein TonB
VAVTATHVRPPYPMDAKRAGEQGTTKMEVSISPQGAITDCRVTGTSGSERLDSTACSFVRRNWRWEPRDVPGTTKISVIWNLINGR